MSVQLCSQCKSPYWRFRGDHPPKGVCSVPCNDARKAGKRSDVPDLPSNILSMMYEHRRDVHKSTSILDFFDGCSRCEELEEAYSDALEYHYDRITREIVSKART